MGEQALLLVRQVDRRELSRAGKYILVEKDYVLEVIDPNVFDMAQLLSTKEYLLLPSNEFITLADAVNQSGLESESNSYNFVKKALFLAKKWERFGWLILLR